VNRPTSGVPDRGTSGSARATGTRPVVSTLAILLVSGLALRLIIAYLLPGSGFRVDIISFQAWAADLAKNGLYGFYDRPFFHDYTPGYLYALWLVGQVGRAIGGIGDLIKIPAILSDVALAWLVHRLVLDLGGSRQRALVGAAIVLINPITWFDSTIWGQVDSFGVVFLLLSLRELWLDRPERAALFATVGAVVKPQLGIMVPLVAFIVIRRAFFGRGTDADGVAAGLPPQTEPPTGDVAPPSSDMEVGSPSLLARYRSWESWTGHPTRIMTTGLAGLLGAAALSAPFGLSIVDLAYQVAKTAGGYAYLTVNAYNPWALISKDGMGLAANGQWLCDSIAVDPATNQPCPAGMETLIGPFWAVFVGAALLLAVIVAVCLVCLWRPDRRSILVGLAVLAIAFFVVPTRVHERYLFPFFAVGAVLAAVSLRWRVAYVVLMLANFANTYVVLTTLYPADQHPGISDWLGIGGAIRSDEGVTIIALAHLAVFLWALAQLRTSARKRLAREVAAAGLEPEDEWEAPREERDEEPERSPLPTPAPASVPGAYIPGPSAARTVAPMTASSDAGYDWEDEDEGVIAWIRRRLLARPVWPDRSRGLHAEPGGRVDRLDVWLVVVLVVASLFLRLWRLSDPPQMHFDEVYHARTATEFLQKWRYGMDHDIYEWTHPHLAKYAMAAGIVLFGDDQVTATSSLGVPVRDAIAEPRWDDPQMPDDRAGDRLYVATGSDVRVFDLRTRQRIGTIAAPDAVALAIDATDHQLYIGASSGVISSVDTAVELDPIRSGTADAPGAGTADGPTVTPTKFADAGAAVRRLFATDDGTYVAASTDGDRLVTIDAATQEIVGRASFPGLSDIAAAGMADALVARPSDVPDHAAAATALARILGGTAATYRKQLDTDATAVTISSAINSTKRGAVDAAINDGSLVGMEVQQQPRLALADTAGVTFVAPIGATTTSSINVRGPATGMALITGIDGTQLYVATGQQLAIVKLGDTADIAPTLQTTVAMPGTVSRVAWDPATLSVHALGRTPDGSSDTIYVIEPHANAVYADARLPFQTSAWAIDIAPKYLAADRQQILAFSSTGDVGSVDIGKNTFGWRLPGVLAGALTAGLIYLLARILFRRRSVALIAGALVLADGMMFVQARIAMNDVYVGLFIVAAYTVFAALWTGMWRRRGAFWVAMPIIGLLLGLALASKWVAAYAIGGIAILMLARSALGRLVLIAGMILGTTVLGYMAVSVPSGATSAGNYVFMAIMIGLTLVAVVASVLHPIAWLDDEVRFAIGAPVAAGIAAFLAAAALGGPSASIALASHSFPLLGLALTLVLLGGLTWLAFDVLGRAGFGPMARPRAPTDPAALFPPASPPPTGWLRLGWGLGLPAAWAAASIVALPLVVYVVSYIPWALIDGHQIGFGWPPGHNGQSLVDLTKQMYDYHNGLRATHPASSPWWAWPFDLKPVWFYQGSFANDTAASIYDAGTYVIWWLGVPAMAFAAFQAFRRRSLGLALISIAFACQWLAWARIDRATFQYHYYAALPFLLLAAAYFIAEVWHGASQRTWLLARVSAALVIVGPMLLWLFKAPLCGFVRVEAVNPGSQACVGNPGELVLTGQVAALGAVVALAVLLSVWQLLRLDDPGPDGLPQPRRRLAMLGAIAVAALLGIGAVGLLPASSKTTALLSLPGFRAEALAFVILLPLGFVAWFVATARDARRFVVGLLAGIVGWFIVLYPNIAALPLPTIVVNAYQGLFPTYLYPFQFPVNTDPVGSFPKLLDWQPAILLGALALTCLIIAYSAWVWRIALVEREMSDSAGPDTGLAPSSGQS
jgi:hypothetical protein